MLLQFELHVVNFFELIQEPWIDAGHLGDLLYRMTLAQGVTHIREALRVRRDQSLGEDPGLNLLRANLLPRIERAHSFEQRFLERAADSHHFADRFHLRTKALVSTGKLLELPLGNLYDYVVQGGLERCGCFPRNVVGNFVQRVADSQFCRNLGDRETSGLGSQSRRSRYPRVHLDHRHPPGVRIYRKLNIRSAGLDPDLADHGNCRIAHVLILAIRESLGGSDGNRVSGVHAHGIEVLDRADDDDVTFHITHHLKLVLFPTQHRLFDQHFVNGREIETSSQDFQQLLPVVSDASAGATKSERGRHDHWKANLPREFQAVFQIVDQRRFGHIEADLLHSVFEEEPVLSFLDSPNVRANQPNVKLLKHAAIRKLHRHVQRSLTAHRGKQREALAAHHFALEPDDLRHVIAMEWLDVSAVGNVGIGHDRGRIRIDQHDFVTFRLQRLASLRAGVIEFGRLSDNDWSGADDENLGDVSSFWH